jgi:hypothetical protein
MACSNTTARAIAPAEPDKSPAEAGPMLAQNRLPFAAREPESGKADSEQREGRGLRHCGGADYQTMDDSPDIA